MASATIERNELIESKPAKESYIAFSVTEETVRPMADKYMSLRINGIDDAQGIAKVQDARSDARRARTTVEAEREVAKKYYLEGGRKVDAAAKRIQELIAPIEKHLVSELDKVEAENQRIQNERLSKRLAGRMEILEGVGGIPDVVSVQYNADLVRVMTDERFVECVAEMRTLNDRLMAEAKAKHEESERQRIEAAKLAEERTELDRLRKAEQERQRIEQDRLDAERAAQRKIEEAELAEQRRLAAAEQKILDEQRAEQKKEADRLQAERKRIADEEASKARKIEADRVEAERLAQIEADKKRSELAKPLRERVLAYRDALLAVEVPNLEITMVEANHQINELRKVIRDGLTVVASKIK